MPDPLTFVLVALAASASFFVSSAAGLGGSLILVPSLALVLGTKEGVALGALLLGANNVVKVVAYHRTVPLVRALMLAVLTVVGSFIGARLLVAAREVVVTVVVILSFTIALLAERHELGLRESALAPFLALGSGATSGFSGTSGPLKGVAVRSLGLDRLHTVGAAALVSMFGDLTKATVFTEGELLRRHHFLLAAIAFPLMLAATLTGRRFTTAIGETGYERLFWLVMGGYSVRLLLLL